MNIEAENLDSLRKMVRDLQFDQSGQSKLMNIVVSQPSIRGIIERISDFLLFSENSVTFYPTFIEIEAPSKVIIV